MYNNYSDSDILLIGGPTQICLLKNSIDNILQNNNKILNLNNYLYKTVVSQGGTYFYNLINEKDKFCLLDIIPMNIGISDIDNKMIIMIDQKSKIPISIEKIFTTTNDYQRVIDVEIFEGIDIYCTNNSLIGSYKIVGLPPLARGAILIKLLFKISYNGILNITINGFKNSNDNTPNSFDFKINENIKLIPSNFAKELLKKILMSEKK